MNLLSHVTLALALSQTLGLNMLYLIIGAVLPDFDYLIGVTHRTIMHSLLFLVIIFLISYKINKKKGTSLLIGLLSHVLLDVLTTQGVMLLWPIKTFYTYSLFNSLENTPNLLVIIVSLILLWNKDIISEKLRLLGYKKVQLLTYTLLLAPILLTIPYYYCQISQCNLTSINELLSNSERFKEECVTLQSKICSSINEYTSSSGNTYDLFTICEDNSTLQVWLLNSLNTGLFEGDNITISGFFTTKFEEPELYMIKSVRKN